MGTKMRIKFSMNGVPILSRNDEGNWNVLTDVKTDLRRDDDIFQAKKQEHDQSLTNMAESANSAASQVIQSLADTLNKK